MVLAVFAGLPGVGKSTLAARVATELPAAVLAVDAADCSLRRYETVAALAETRLRAGHHVIIDAVNPVAAARRIWADLAERLDVPLRVVEVVCGDEAEHRRRVGPADWVRVLRCRYEPYPGPRLVVDTYLAEEPAAAVVSYLS
jgi:predicted kinase